MAKSYDITSLEDELVIEPDDVADLKIAIAMLIKEANERADEIKNHFGVSITAIRLDNPGVDVKL